jgi:iron(III) transport system permease protein
MNWPLLANSLLLAGAATGLALLIGFVLAVGLIAFPPAWRKILFILTLTVLALPAFLVTNSWIDLLGTNGVLHRWLPLNVYSLSGATWILALLFWPIPALGLFGAWQKLEPAQLEMESALRGARLVRYLLWPAARPMLAATATVVLALALNNFAVPAILQVKVFPSEVWVQFSTHLDPLSALRLSWPLLLAPLILLFALRRQEFPWPRETTTDLAPGLRRQLGPGWLLAVSLFCLLVVLLALVVPLAQILATSRTWSEFMPAFLAGQAALLRSFGYAALTALVTVMLGLLLVRVRGLGGMWLLFLVPGVLVGIGAISAFNHPGLDWFFRTSGIVLFLLVARYFALARALTRAAHQSLDRDLMDTARIEGATGFALFRWGVWPQIAPSLAAAGYIVYVLCLWDVETILLVIPPGGETLALRVFNLLHYGHNAQVNALCLLLLLLALAPLLLFAMWKVVSSMLGSGPFGETAK